MVNDQSRFNALGTATESTTLAIFNAMQTYYGTATSACSINLRLAGQITFAFGTPTAIEQRACNTVDPNFVNAYASNHPCCTAGSLPTGTCNQMKVWCLQSAGGHATSEAACFDNNGGVSTFTSGAYRAFINLAAGTSSTSANEVDTFNLLLTFNQYMALQRSNIEAVWSPAKLDHYQLLTHKNFDGSTVGLALLSNMCTSNSGNVNQADSTVSGYVASITAHEMGHTLGMRHDQQSPHAACPVGNIMAPCRCCISPYCGAVLVD